MKHAFRYIPLLVALGALLLAGCSKKEIIPDKDLEKITREMFLVNAYAADRSLNTDSLDIYTPILQRYGYSQDDFFNTLANFQKRKSARVGDVVEQSIRHLESLHEGYERKLRELAYVDSVAKAECATEVLFVERVKVHNFRDTAKLRITLPVKDEGEYLVSYNYYVDSLDKNLRLQTSHSLYEADSTRNHLIRTSLQRKERKRYSTVIHPKRGSVRYEILLADYAHREDEPHIEFDSLKVVYLPSSAFALARMDSLLRFRPALYDNDSIRARGYLDARIPMLAHDTVWVAIDSVELAEAAALRLRADSLNGEADKRTKEAEKLTSRSEKLLTEAQKKWFRNDSLRQVAHQKNVALADSLRADAEALFAERSRLSSEALEALSVADSIEVVILGEPRK